MQSNSIWKGLRAGYSTWSALVPASRGKPLLLGLRRMFSSSRVGRTLFKPPTPLYFKKGKCLIAKESRAGFKLFVYSVGVVSFFFLQKSAFKLLDLRNRGFFGFCFYVGMLAGSVFLLRASVNAMRTFITEVKLSSCGEMVFIKNGVPFMPETSHRIRNIKRPGGEGDREEWDPQWLVVGFQVRLDGETHILPRAIERVHPEVFAAIFNGVEIDTEEDIIDIE
jgi:hypothetical protein